MKKLLTLLSTLAFACTLSVPMFAAKSPKPAKAQDSATAVHTKTTKAHRKHSKKQAMKSNKKQKAMTPAPTSK